MRQKRVIVAEYGPDSPASGYDVEHRIPWVVCSTHERFVEGTRFDYGFLQIALRDGYEVLITQAHANQG